MLGSGNIGPPHHGRPTAHGMHRLAGGIGGMTRGFNNGKYFNYTYIKEILYQACMPLCISQIIVIEKL